MTKEAAPPAYAVECHGITKSFGSVLANDHVELNVKYGEILAILGENGSGKTTLMNMLSGIYYPDSGKTVINGEETIIHSPSDSMRLGIGMIHQHFKLVDVFSAMDNIVLGEKGRYISSSSLMKKISEISASFGLEIDPEKKVYNMSVSEKQTVEILKVLYRGAKILILDEPTAVLTPQETERLFKILKNMRSNGCAIIIITHKLNEVMEISDRVGAPVSLKIDRPETENKKTLLKVVDLTVMRSDGSVGLDSVNFTIKSGEILGIAGIAGSGQKELCEAIAGLLEVKEGAILFKKENIVGKTPYEIISLGISMSFVPEDRLGMGLVASMGITENMMLKSYYKGKGAFIDKKPAKAAAEEIVKKLEISTPGLETPVRMLSGGNVQKVLLGREISSNPNLLIAAYPVRGLDINSSYNIYHLLNDQKKKGVAVVFIGEDLDVLLEISDRILVLCHGQVTGVVDAKTATKEALGLMMVGVKGVGAND